jgi:3-oxoacyl-[acyl-carrier protein] reductase
VDDSNNRGLNGNRSLDGKVAIVTGAGQGIGEAVAVLFAQQGAQVVVNARTKENVERVAARIRQNGGEAHALPADIGTPEGVKALVDGTVAECGQIDILVHNAGIFPYNPLEDMDDEAWQQVIDVNLTAGYRLTRACIPSMKAQGGGRILFTSSVQGNHTAVPGCSHYAASKGGLNGFIRAAAFELAEHQITVNGVEPGLVLTAGIEDALSPRRRDLMAQYVPLKRWGEPEEVAHAMLYLASPEAGYVTGQTIVLDGGALLPQNGSFMVR